MDDLTARFATALGDRRARARRRRRRAARAATPRSRGCREHPIPVLSAAGSVTAARRAAAARRRARVRLAHDAGALPRARRRVPRRRRAPARACSSGGRGSASRRRSRPRSQLDTYRSYAPAARPRNWGTDEMAAAADAGRGRRTGSSTRPDDGRHRRVEPAGARARRDAGRRRGLRSSGSAPTSYRAFATRSTVAASPGPEGQSMQLSDIDLLDRDRFTQGIPHEWFTFLRNEAPVYKHPEPDGPGLLGRHQVRRRRDRRPRRRDLLVRPEARRRRGARRVRSRTTSSRAATSCSRWTRPSTRATASS